MAAISDSRLQVYILCIWHVSSSGASAFSGMSMTAELPLPSSVVDPCAKAITDWERCCLMKASTVLWCWDTSGVTSVEESDTLNNTVIGVFMAFGSMLEFNRQIFLSTSDWFGLMDEKSQWCEIWVFECSFLQHLVQVELWWSPVADQFTTWNCPFTGV